MSQTIEIRNVDPQSVDALSLLYEAFVDAQKLYPEFITPDALPPGNEPVTQGGVYVIAYRANVPLACGALRSRTEGAEVRRMYVHREQRRQGLASQVLRHLVLEAVRLGHRRLVLETGFRQSAAMRLYESCGFQVIEPFGEYVVDPTSVCYERLLSPEA